MAGAAARRPDRRLSPSDRLGVLAEGAGQKDDNQHGEGESDPQQASNLHGLLMLAMGLFAFVALFVGFAIVVVAATTGVPDGRLRR